MAESIFRPAAVLHWWREASVERKSFGRNSKQRSPVVSEHVEAGTDQLINILDEAAETGRRVAEEVSAASQAQPTANAASICRWRLLTLRQRLLDLGGKQRFGPNGNEAL